MERVCLMIYIISVSLQIAGALVLILKYMGRTRQRVINEYFPGTGGANNDGYDNATLELKKVKECIRTIYANRIAFFYIAIGYLVSIFGDKGLTSSLLVFIIVLFLSMLFVFLEKGLAVLISNLLYKDDLIIPYDELPEHISRSMSKKDVDEIIGLLK